MTDPAPLPENQADLGLGRVLAQESAQRFVNKDGSFNSARDGLSFWSSLSLYYTLITLPWSAFFALVLLGYLLVNVTFALLYLLCGPAALSVAPDARLDSRLWQAFFFSVQTFATIGYGKVTPSGLAANLLVTVEALVGLLGVALATGLLFARFARPKSRILFSHNAVIAPYSGGRALMFRIINGQRNQIIELEAEVTLSRFEEVGGVSLRRFYELRLARPKVAFFPLAWTVVHPIDADSPLAGSTDEDLRQTQAEVLVQIRGMDDTLFQTVRARTSYKADELVWNARFADMYRREVPGRVAVDVRRLHHIDVLQEE